MKNVLVVLVSVALCCMGELHGQINIGDRLEQKAKERLDRKVDRTMDRGLDKAEEGVDKGARGATQGKKGSSAPAGDGDSPAEDAPASGGNPGGGANSAPATLKAYSKFDFVPGERIIAFEDFSQDAIGDFPAKWNTNSAGEVVTISGREGRYLKLSGAGIFYPEFLGEIPDNATLEFNAAVMDEYSFYCGGITLHFIPDAANLLRFENEARVSVSIGPQDASGSRGHTGVIVHAKDGSMIMSNERSQSGFVHRNIAPFARISVWRQKNRLRVYINEEKVWDLPRAFQEGVKYRMVVESGSCGESVTYMGDLRVAAGAPDTRNKLISEGKLVTRGILFDSGSDRIKPESYGTLKDIAATLSENAGVRVRIIGHTDSDGDAAKNLELSKRRAASVKEALTKEFGIDAGRMETDGKGQSDPAGPNDSPQGKANNRRVEFVKL
ncbi:MAG: OmpA family protein [Flavobacteriales bacterium]|nr:OmpA family protein [Flavobacteriales bacterium]